MKNKWIITTAIAIVVLILAYFLRIFTYTVTVMLSLVTIYGVTIFWLYWSSRQGLPRNRPFVTECPFKYAMITKRGSRYLKVITGGRVQYDDDFLLVNGCGSHVTLDPEGNVENLDSFIKNPNANKKGIAWIGIPFIDKIALFHFEWNDIVEENVDGQITQHIKQMTTEDEKTEFFAVYKTFGFLAESLEVGFDKTKIDPSNKNPSFLDKIRMTYARTPIDMVFALTILIVDASKAICTLNWYKGLRGIIRQKCLEYCGDHNIDEIIDDSGENLNKFIMSLNREILDKFGVVITKSSYNGFNFSGTNAERKKMEENAQKAWLAEQDKLAEMQKTDGKVYDITKTAEAQAQATEVTAKANAHRIRLEGDATAKAQKALYEGLGEQNAIPYAIATTQVSTLLLGNTGVGINLPPKP